MADLPAPSTEVLKTAKPRLALLDGLRGYFLAMMMLHHLVFDGGTSLALLHHASLGFVEDAQGFVFLSGFVLGLVYTKVLARQGWEALRQKSRTRIWELYQVIVLTFVVLLVAVALWPELAPSWQPYLGNLTEGPSSTYGALLALVYQPDFGDVLPQYMLYILVAPWLIRAFQRGQASTVLGCSLMLWGLSNLGLHYLLVDGLAWLLQSLGLAPETHLKAYFNPFGWQLIFVAGLFLGWDMAPQGGQQKALSWILKPRSAWVWTSTIAVVFFLVMRVLHGQGAIPGHYADSFYRVFNRSNLSLVHVLNFMATAYLFTWFLRHQGRVGQGLRTFFHLPFFVFLGQHSLQVYAFHVVVVYALIGVDSQWGPFPESLKWTLGGAAVLALGLPARYHQAKQRRKAQRSNTP